MHLCAFTCINAHAALEVHLQNIVVNLQGQNSILDSKWWILASEM